MKILFFEDNAQALKMAKLLKDEYKHQVYHTDRYTDVIDWLGDVPGAHAFDALFFDLNVPRISMPESIRALQPGVPSGWVFINEWLVKEYPFLKPRIVLYTAYLDLIGDDANQYLTADKSDPRLVPHILEILGKISKLR